MDNFSFDDLAITGNPIETTTALQSQIQSLAEESFPDDEGANFKIIRAVSVDTTRYIEVMSDAHPYFPRYVFELDDNDALLKCYSFEGAYSLLFS